MQTRTGLLRVYLMTVVCMFSLVCFAQEPADTKQQNAATASKTAGEKKDLIINTRMDTLSVIFQNTLIPIQRFSQLDSFIRFNLMGIAKPRVEIRGYPGNTYENYDKVVAILKKNKITDFSFGMATVSP